jgi:hypothetical protein
MYQKDLYKLERDKKKKKAIAKGVKDCRLTFPTNNCRTLVKMTFCGFDGYSFFGYLCFGYRKVSNDWDDTDVFFIFFFYLKKFYNYISPSLYREKKRQRERDREID